MFPLTKRFVTNWAAEPVDISFCDARLCAVFNSYSLLCDRFGQEVAQSISIRMGVLSAAPRLAAVPRKPPISLRAEKGTYTVSLASAKRLRFQPTDQDGANAAPDPAAVSGIEIVGVEG